jgi:hypothetical protein
VSFESNFRSGSLSSSTFVLGFDKLFSLSKSTGLAGIVNDISFSNISEEENDDDVEATSKSDYPDHIDFLDDLSE